MPAQQQKVDKEKTRPQIPALPPGTQLDLSLPKITAPDVPPFTLPAELSMAANEAAVEFPAELSPGGLDDCRQEFGPALRLYDGGFRH